MFGRSKLRSSREDRMENGVKNLDGSEAIPKNLSCPEMKILALFLLFSAIQYCILKGLKLKAEIR